MGDVSGKSVVDVGTGSGVLAISAALSGATAVVAVDISRTAVDCARANVSSLELQKLVTVHESDLFENIAGKHDIILANLPIYIDAGNYDIYKRFFVASPI